MATHHSNSEMSKLLPVNISMNKLAHRVLAGMIDRLHAVPLAGLSAKLITGLNLFLFPNFLTKLIAGLLAALPAFLAPPVLAQELDVPYYTTEPEVVDGMMDMAGVGPGDYLIDLGSGDGRIVIAAALRGAVGHGVDLDPARIAESDVNAGQAGVADRVMFLEEDLFDTDFSQATVVTMFLLSAVNLRLRPFLLDRLQPGTRVISHTFDMDDWKPDKRQTIGRRPVYLWVIPADATGEWVWKRKDSARITMSVNRKFQMIDVTVTSGGRTLTTDEATLRGDRITLIIQDEQNGTRYVCNGTIDGDSITGTLHIHSDDGRHMEIWTAVRN